MDSGHSILNFKTQGSMLMLGVQEEKQELQDSEHRAVVLGCCCGLAECLWTCPWGLLFFSFRAGNLAQILNVAVQGNLKDIYRSKPENPLPAAA